MNYESFIESNPELMLKVLLPFLVVFVGLIAAIITLIVLIVKAIRHKALKGTVIAFIVSILVFACGLFLSFKTSLSLAEEYSQYTVTQEMDNYSGDIGRISFSSADKDGNPVDSSVFGDYELTLINRWEPWCGPCKSEMPDLQKLYEHYSGRVNIIGVYSDDDLLEETLESLSVSYPIVRNCEGFDFLGLGGVVPTTVFVDSEGRLLEIPVEQRSSAIKGSSVSASETGAMFDRYAMIGSRSYEVWDGLIQNFLEN